MSDPLGLSIGAANLVAARTGDAPVTRSSVLTLFPDRPPEVGVPDENPRLNGRGLALSEFVARVGDPDPLIAADGSAHSGEALSAAALDGMARTVGYGAPVAIAVPGHWAEHRVDALRAALRGYPALAPEAAPPAYICDGTAALAALYAQPGFPNDGVVVLCDFGASGSSITLTDAAANFRQIAPTLRYTDFSGNQLDHLILRHVAYGSGGDADGTAPLSPLGRRLSQCRSAKEQLSAATVAVIPADLPGIGEDVRLARGEFEDLISEPLDGFIGSVGEMLRRNRIPVGRLAAIATVGGGACIPLITSRLSERLEAPIVTTSQPQLSAAIGAAVLAQLRSSAGVTAPVGAAGDAATAAAEAPDAVTEGVDPTEMAPAAWAVGAASSAAGQSVADGDQSATHRALAWSQVASGEIPVPDVESHYLADDYAAPDVGPATGVAPADEPPPAAPAPPRSRSRWYKRPSVLVSSTGAIVLILLVAAGLALRLGGAGHKPTENVHNVTPPVESSQLQPPPPAPATTTVVAPTSEPTESPSPPPSTTTVTSTQQPTTTSPPSTTHPTTTSPSTTYPTTTYPTTPYPANPYPTYPTNQYPYPVNPGVAPTVRPYTPAPDIPR